MSVGDITSQDRGTGARFNDEKPKFEYLTCRAILDAHGIDNLETAERAGDGFLAAYVLMRLAGFEETHSDRYLRDALSTICKIDESTLHDIAAVFHYGAQKYAPWNWAKGMPWSVPLACIKRHCSSLLRVVDNSHLDSESGLRHLAHAGCNIVMLLHYTRYHQELNDLPSTEWFNEPQRPRKTP